MFGAVIVLATRFLMSSPSPAPATDTVRRNDFRTATIVTDALDDSGCRQRDFDNQTGRMTQADQPCNNGTVLDSHGNPVPIGTIHRLDGISRSFFGR
jgi:hypothetical protein